MKKGGPDFSSPPQVDFRRFRPMTPASVALTVDLARRAFPRERGPLLVGVYGEFLFLCRVVGAWLRYGPNREGQAACADALRFYPKPHHHGKILSGPFNGFVAGDTDSARVGLLHWSGCARFNDLLARMPFSPRLGALLPQVGKCADCRFQNRCAI